MYMLIGSPGQWFVADSMRLCGIFAFTLLVILDVFLIVAFEPEDLRVALEGEDMSCDAVKEPAIVRDDDRATRERDQRIFERAQRFDIEVIGRLVEQQDVAAGLQYLRQMH